MKKITTEENTENDVNFIKPSEDGDRSSKETFDDKNRLKDVLQMGKFIIDPVATDFSGKYM